MDKIETRPINSGNERKENEHAKYVINSKSIVTTVGRLRERVSKWAEIGANAEILGIIENGYKLPLHTIPEEVELRNNRSALEHSEFVKGEIENVLRKRCVTETNLKPTAVNPLTVSENKCKCRMVVDCRHINPHLFKNKFKYEDASVASDLVFTFDLKSAYHHVDIVEQHRQYLGFAWDFEGKKNLFFD